MATLILIYSSSFNDLVNPIIFVNGYWLVMSVDKDLKLNVFNAISQHSTYGNGLSSIVSCLILHPFHTTLALLISKSISSSCTVKKNCVLFFDNTISQKHFLLCFIVNKVFDLISKLPILSLGGLYSVDIALAKDITSVLFVLMVGVIL